MKNTQLDYINSIQNDSEENKITIEDNVEE